MKLTTKTLKNMILEAMNEATQETEYKRTVDMLSGDVESVDQVAILTAENPKSMAISPQQNAARLEEFKKELSSAGYGWNDVSGMYDRPEQSLMVPHMSLDDAKKFSYKYGQESFVHSSRGEEQDMTHSLEFPDFIGEEIDETYDDATYGPILNVPPSVNIKSSTPGSTVLGDDQMGSAKNYYSHVPNKEWDAKTKDGEEREAGEKLGKKYAVDLEFDKTMPHGYTPKAGLRSPRYFRENKYIHIAKTDVPNTIEAQALMENIHKLSLKISESNRLGSSKYYARMRMRSMKQQLFELIQESR